MKRDMDLVRKLLIGIEADKECSGDFVSEEYPEDIVFQHLKLMDYAGFITGSKAETFDGGEYLNLKLTWEGHDFLDAVRSETVWNTTKQKLKDAGGWTVDLIKQVAIGVITAKLAC